MIVFRTDGEPVPKQSFRVAIQNGRRVRGYTDKRVGTWANMVALQAKLAMARDGRREFFSGPLAVYLAFELTNNRRVDLDNLSKCVLDACNGVLWKDDSSVVALQILKRVNKLEPGVTVLVENYDKSLLSRVANAWTSLVKQTDLTPIAE